MSQAIVVPPLGESITEAVLSRWLRRQGETVSSDEPVAEIETDKVSLELRAPVGGVLIEQRASVGDSVRIGEIIGRVETNGAEKGSTPSDGQPMSGQPRVEVTRPGELPAAVPRLVEATPSARPTPLPAPRPSTPPTQATDEGDEEAVPMSPLRRRVAERLLEAKQKTASLTTFNEVDMSEVMAIRRRQGEGFLARHGVKLGLMSFVAKACLAALREYPGLNAEVRQQSIVYKRHYDLGIAVSTERGLVVPVLRGADRLTMAEIEQRIAGFAEKARANQLTLDDLSGGTFSITNGGVFGSMLSTPILNYPQTGILGLHNIVRRPVAVGEKVEIRPIMYVALTYDHRVVDGREAVSFLVAVKQRVEHPELLLF